MTFNEALTLVALFVGPTLAVLIQLRAERRKQQRDRQVETMRMLVSTRHLGGDPRWTQAINMVPIDFNAVGAVMTAWRAYQAAIKYEPTPSNAETHIREINAKQTNLIFQILVYLGYDIPETEIQESAYAARGMIARDNLMLAGWEAWPKSAKALERNTEILEATIASTESK